MNNALKLLGGWILSVCLLLAYGYMWLAYGIGDDLTPMRRAVLLAGIVVIVISLVTGAMRRARVTAILQGVAIAGIIGLTIQGNLEMQAEKDAVVPRRIADNEKLLARGIVTLNCRNGDTAVLGTTRFIDDSEDALTIYLVPQDHGQLSYSLISTNNRHRPVSDDGSLQRYIKNTGNDCSNGDYRSLLDLMPRLRAHDEAWRRSRGLAAGG